MRDAEMTLETVLQEGLSDPDCGWSMGSFGAIAEFHHVGDDPRPVAVDSLCQSTARGAIRIERLSGVRPVAYEMLSPNPNRWTQGVALCLPEADARMHGRDVLTELGPDDGAIRAADKGAVLFDMGLAQPQVDFCIRTEDPALIALLRAEEGRSLFEPDNPAMPAILKAHPHRVALTRLGRVEVYQLIGGPDTGGKSPEGPHTHVLPKLLRANRTHSANTPIPAGWVPCCGLHPKSPVSDVLGQDKAFDPEAFADFQRLLSLWGAQDYVAEKQTLWAALEAGHAPEGAQEAATRLTRVARRNAIRQWRRQQGDSPLISAWAQKFDSDPTDAPPENPGH